MTSRHALTVAETVAALGGSASRAQLLRWHTRRDLEVAIGEGVLRRSGRSGLTLPDQNEAVHQAVSLGGLVSHASAAQLHGWEIARQPDRPHVTVPKGRRLLPSTRRRVHLHFVRTMPPGLQGRTGIETTLRDCLRALPADEALALADSVLRQGVIGRAGLESLADATRGPGTLNLRRAVRLATPLAANPFESVLRHLAFEAGLAVEPQVSLLELGMRPDLVDRQRRIILEADSFEWHGKRSALQRDARRYDRMVVAGWLVLRFSWEDVMLDPAWVLALLQEAARMRNKGPAEGRRPA
ncbi:MAG: DUF559 domain-containing protein [Nocardioides sp.]